MRRALQASQALPASPERQAQLEPPAKPAQPVQLEPPGLSAQQVLPVHRAIRARRVMSDLPEPRGRLDLLVGLEPRVRLVPQAHKATPVPQEP